MIYMFNLQLLFSRAWSVTWNPHKMMGVPLQCSVILVKKKVRNDSLLLFNLNVHFKIHKDIWELFNECFKCASMPVSLSLEISQQLSDGLPSNFTWMFMVARGLSLIHFSDPLTYSLVPSWGGHLFRIKCLNNWWMNCHKVWFIHLF